MKVLLLGAKGMLGHALQKEFAHEDLTAWDRNELDITNQEEVLSKIPTLQPAVIINAAAYTAVDAAEANRELAFSVNEDGVRNVAEAAKGVNAAVVHYSTDYVFPGDRQEGYVESDQPGPAVNAYGDSKLAGEKVLRESGVQFYLLRTAWLYGEGGKNFVDTMLRLSRERAELRVVNDQFGSPTFTRDLAAATKRVLTEKKFGPGMYHAVNGGVATWYEFAREALTLAGRTCVVVPITSAEYPLPAKRPQYSVLRDSKGLTFRPWQEALKEYIAELKTQK